MQLNYKICNAALTPSGGNVIVPGNAEASESRDHGHVHNNKHMHTHVFAKFWRVGSVNHRAILLTTHSPKASGFCFLGQERKRASDERDEPGGRLLSGLASG